jgi:hypothetical protein
LGFEACPQNVPTVSPGNLIANQVLVVGNPRVEGTKYAQVE